MDDNIAHCSVSWDSTCWYEVYWLFKYEAGDLEDPSIPAPVDMWTRTDDPRTAPDEPVDITIRFEGGLPVKLTVGDKSYTDSLELFVKLNEIGKKAGIGRIDIVEVSSSTSFFLRCISVASTNMAI